MLHEPVAQAQRIGRLVVRPGLIVLHDVAQDVQQPLVILLMRGVGLVAVIPHQTFLEREVSGNTRIQLAQQQHGLLRRGVGHQRLVRLVDQIDELAMFVIHGRIIRTIFFVPFDERHRSYPVVIGI
jgi:hypothetical protein